MTVLWPRLDSSLEEELLRPLRRPALRAGELFNAHLKALDMEAAAPINKIDAKEQRQAYLATLPATGEVLSTQRGFCLPSSLLQCQLTRKYV